MPAMSLARQTPEEIFMKNSLVHLRQNNKLGKEKVIDFP
jgi:hypothetical protein